MNIKPCPFKCKNPSNLEPFVEPQHMNDGELPNILYLVRCQHCDASGPVEETEDKAIQSWNRYEES